MSEPNINEHQPEGKYTGITTVALMLAIGVCLFFLGRQSKVLPAPEPAVNVSHLIKTRDCLMLIAAKRLDTILVQKHLVDSITKKRTKNNHKVKTDVDKIKVFTPVTRLNWRDSVRAANGIK